MMTATMRRGLAGWRQPQRAARLALGLWIVWAIVLWNVVLDHVIVMAGRAYLYAAALADVGRGPQVRMDDFMRPAVTRGVWIASACALAVLVVGIVGVRAGSRASRPLTS